MTSTAASCPHCGSEQLLSLGKLPESRWFAGKNIEKPLQGGNLYRCCLCRLKFRHPKQDMATYQRLYDNAAVSAWPINAERPDWDLITGHISEHAPQGSRVLDFGCYTGGLLARISPAYERYGIEINKAAAAIANGSHLMQVWLSIDDVPNDMRFDVVILSDVIEHINNPGHLIGRIFKLLKQDGILIITTGDADCRLWNRFGANWWYCFYPEHIAFLSLAWLKYYSKTSELLIKKCEHFRYRNLSPTRLFIETIFTYIYGYFPRAYIFFRNLIRNILGRQNLTNAPGNGVSADHLFIVLAQKESIHERQHH